MEALRVGDIILHQGNTVQDESADTVTLEGQITAVDAPHGAVTVGVSAAPGGRGHRPIGRGRRHSAIPAIAGKGTVRVLLDPQALIDTPGGHTVAALHAGQRLRATGALNTRTHTLMLTSSVSVIAAVQRHDGTLTDRFTASALRH